MFVLGSDIQIGKVRFQRVHSIKVVRSKKLIEDTAVIKIPTSARLKREGDYISEVETAKVFKPGDPVIIRCGYDGVLVTEFVGFVRKVHPKTPLEIECEDAIYLLKRRTLKASFKNKNLKFILNFILKDTGIKLVGNVPGIDFTRFYFREVSAAKALEELKKKYGLVIYFKSLTELYVGLATDEDGTTVKYEFGYNIIKDNLEWVNEDDVKLKVKAIHILKNNKQIVKEVGDKDGETRTLFFYNLDKGQNLKTVAEQEILKYKYNGYKGNFTAFLLPIARVGNVCELVSDYYEGRKGRYLIDGVETTYSQQGGRRKITLGLKV